MKIDDVSFEEHPEYFAAELNQQQRIAYDKNWDKSCIEYHTKGMM